MAWQEVQTDVGAKVGRVKYSVALKHGGARISVPKAVADELGWKKTTTFRLLVGGGETDGKLRLEPFDKGRIVAKAPPSGEGLIIRLGRWPALAPRDVDAVAVEHEVDKGALMVSLPDHARMVQPAARPATPASGGRDANGVPTAARRDVSHQFFNDPKKPPSMASGTRGDGR